MVIHTLYHKIFRSTIEYILPDTPKHLRKFDITLIIYQSNIICI